MPSRFRLLAAVLIGVLPLTGDRAQAEVYRWIEAERPILTNFGPNPFPANTAAERSQLSGGDWIGASGKRTAPLFAVYDVDVLTAGEYRLFARKFWKHGPYRVQFNDGPWLNVAADVPLLDEAELRTNIDVNWTVAGTVTLKAGRNRFRIESTTNDGAIGFDCFVITDGAFRARGTAKPDESLKSDEPGWFAWDPPTTQAVSPIDLRALNEPAAGSEGRIIARDGRFLHETSGKPVRFWGVNCGRDVIRMDEHELDQLATLLASRGVNWVRLHGSVYAQEGKNVGEIDHEQIANVQRAVRTFKRHGIYSTLSVYFPSWLKLDESNGWPGYHQQTPFALLFFDERFQQMYRGWWRELLTTPDPQSVTALKDEPAVLSLEMLNEDSLFFWTFQPRKTIPESVSKLIEQQFGAWLAKRYGSIDAAVAEWNSYKSPDAAAASEGRVGVLDAGSIGAAPTQARSRDTARFLFETERDFYTATRAYLRDELGSKSLISGSNWTTASDRYLTPLERAANLAGDFIDRHGYYNGQHDGPHAGFSVSTGDQFSDRSALRFDAEKPSADAKPNPWNPILDTSFNDRPTMVSEIDWLEPNRFRGEAPLLCAALGAQQDVDALGFFAAGGPTWQATTSKFATLSPVELAQYPAAALIYRLGLVAESPLTDDVQLNLEDLLSLNAERIGSNPRVKFIAKTRVTFGDRPTSRPTFDTYPFVIEKETTISSASDQLSLGYDHGVLTINAPGAQAVVGFLGTMKWPQKMKDVSIHSPMEYGTIAVVSLDARPIRTSNRLLVQVMSEQHNAGWRTSGGPVRTIESFGHPPILVRELAGTITFNDGSQWTAQPLDQNDLPAGDPLPASASLELRPTTVHYLLTRSPAR